MTALAQPLRMGLRRAGLRKREPLRRATFALGGRLAAMGSSLNHQPRNLCVGGACVGGDSGGAALGA